MKFNLKKRKASKKDYDYKRSHKLGAVQLPDEFIITPTILSQDAEDCTAFMETAAKMDENPGSVYDPMQLWYDELKFAGVTFSNGFDLEVPAAVSVLYGYCPMGNPTARQDNNSAYFWIKRDFESVMQALYNAKKPVRTGVEWHNDWINAPGGVITTDTGSILGGHAIRVNGWKTINGVRYAVLANTWGKGEGDQGCYYISEPVFNIAFSEYGAYIPSTSKDITIVTLGRLQALMQNVLTLLRNTSIFKLLCSIK